MGNLEDKIVTTLPMMLFAYPSEKRAVPHAKIKEIWESLGILLEVVSGGKGRTTLRSSSGMA